MKRIILIFFLITGCAVNQGEQKINLSEIKFSEDLSLKEFKDNLEIYANNSPYPDIEN
ncbi:hypothetical protein N9R93_00365 [Candidatus Pelagibacter sp.]|nr:hypothetical protein [Candidatus Pelagibacter sp.]